MTKLRDVTLKRRSKQLAHDNTNELDALTIHYFLHSINAQINMILKGANLLIFLIFKNMKSDYWRTFWKLQECSEKWRHCFNKLRKYLIKHWEWILNAEQEINKSKTSINCYVIRSSWADSITNIQLLKNCICLLKNEESGGKNVWVADNTPLLPNYNQLRLSSSRRIKRKFYERGNAPWSIRWTRFSYHNKSELEGRRKPESFRKSVQKLFCSVL